MKKILLFLMIFNMTALASSVEEQEENKENSQPLNAQIIRKKPLLRRTANFNAKFEQGIKYNKAGETVYFDETREEYLERVLKERAINKN